MASSDVEICNLALSRVGVKRFISAFTDTTTEAQVCNLVYANVRDAVLEEVDWPFARRRSTLTATTETRTNWAYTFAVPADLIAARKLIVPGMRNPPSRGRYPFAMELADDGFTKMLLSDVEAPELLYTSRVTAVGNFSPLFTLTFGWALAAELGPSLSAKSELQTWAQTNYLGHLAKAVSAYRAQEQEDQVPDSEFISGRS